MQTDGVIPFQKIVRMKPKILPFQFEEEAL